MNVCKKLLRYDTIANEHERSVHDRSCHGPIAAIRRLLCRHRVGSSFWFRYSITYTTGLALSTSRFLCALFRKGGQQRRKRRSVTEERKTICVSKVSSIRAMISQVVHVLCMHGVVGSGIGGLGLPYTYRLVVDDWFASIEVCSSNASLFYANCVIPRVFRAASQSLSLISFSHRSLNLHHAFETHLKDLVVLEMVCLQICLFETSK